MLVTMGWCEPPTVRTRTGFMNHALDNTVRQPSPRGEGHSSPARAVLPGRDAHGPGSVGIVPPAYPSGIAGSEDHRWCHTPSYYRRQPAAGPRLPRIVRLAAYPPPGRNKDPRAWRVAPGSLPWRACPMVAEHSRPMVRRWGCSSACRRRGGGSPVLDSLGKVHSEVTQQVPKDAGSWQHRADFGRRRGLRG